MGNSKNPLTVQVILQLLVLFLPVAFMAVVLIIRTALFDSFLKKQFQVQS